MSDIERHFDRMVKVLALVARGSTEGECAAAAQRVAQLLKDHPLPVRWFVAAGTPVKLIPSLDMADLTAAKAVIRVVELPAARWFTERERVKVNDLKALNAGYLYFEKHGYAIFIPVNAIEPRL